MSEYSDQRLSYQDSISCNKMHPQLQQDLANLSFAETFSQEKEKGSATEKRLSNRAASSHHLFRDIGP